MFLFVADEVLSDGTQPHSTCRIWGEGGYFKLINKTSWQEHCFLQIAGALVATLCQDQALKLVRIHNKVLHLLWLCVSLECPCFTYKYLHTMRITMDYT